MEALELLDLIQRGEDSRVQFKERVQDAHSISQEMVALSNAEGGILIIGVDDRTGTLNGLNYHEIQRVNNLLVDAATNNVRPGIIIRTETIQVADQNVVVVYISPGMSKPYKDRNGVVWIKNGSDKRRVTSNEELARLLQTSRLLFADEMLVQGTSLADINLEHFGDFVKAKYHKTLAELNMDLGVLLRNLNLAKDGVLTLAGLLLFGANRQRYRPQYSLQCVSVADIVITGTDFLDNEPAFEGDLKAVFDQTITFIDRNLHKVPGGTSFNSPVVWEVPYEVFEELVVNALIHRDYFVNTTIKVYIFSDRIEIISPGKLPNSLTVENIKNGISIPRNPILQSMAQYILPYKGLGTGISRALAIYPEIEFVNSMETEQFKAIIKRPNVNGDGSD